MKEYGNKARKILVSFFTFIFSVLIICIVILYNSNHIIDTNAYDDYTVTTITDDDILKQKYKAYGIDDTLISETRFIESNRFSGIYEIYEKTSEENIIIPKFSIKVYKGNLRVVMVSDEQIIRDFDVNKTHGPIKLKSDIDDVKIYIIGESAKFKLLLV